MRKPCAYSLIRSQPVYRRQAFEDGLSAVGYEVCGGVPAVARPGDVLISWNRYSAAELMADRWEAQGGTVIVAENAYLDPGRHVDRRWYAMAIGGHNGSGNWPDGGPERWAEIAPKLGVELKPWRERGEHILVCPSRAFGRRDLIMPAGWAQSVVERLQRLTRRPVRIRAHPGNNEPQKPLSEDLEGAWVVVIWHSSAGVHALAAGIPVICESQAWILKAAGTKLEEIERPPMLDRQGAFERMAWAQWEVAEIQSGEAFDHLLRRTDQGEESAAA